MDVTVWEMNPNRKKTIKLFKENFHVDIKTNIIK